MTKPEQTRWMLHALALAERGAGTVSPNPLVGAVLIGPDGDLWGQGWHGRYGGPHAEVWAVRDAERNGFGELLAEATMVVTLEPCSHHGNTPPCADLVIERDIRRIVVAMEDPNPKVAGRGLARLRDAGAQVSVGACGHEAARLNEAFVHHVGTGRPLVTLKIAATLDGQVATASGDSRWVTSPDARALVHRWRAESDAVLIGSGTALSDDPALTVRDWPLFDGATQPLRVVLDRAGALPASLALFSDEHAGRTLAITAEASAPTYRDALESAGGRVWSLPTAGAHLDLAALLTRLGSGTNLPDGVRPVQSVLVEAGPGLATALLRADLVDRLYWFVAPKLVGDGISATGDLGMLKMADALTFAESRWEAVGPDMLFRGFMRPV